MKFLYVLGYLVACILSICASTVPCNDPISCALAGISIEVNNLNISISGNTFVINTLLCTNVTVGSIPSAYVPPSSLNISIQNTFISCAGKYTYQQASGPFTVALSKFSLGLEATVAPKNISGIDYPWAFQVPHCGGSLTATVVLIGKSGIAVNKVEQELAGLLAKAIPQTVCTKLTSTLQVNATNTLESSIDPLLMAIASQHGITPPVYDSSYVNWNELLSLVDLVASVIKANNPGVIDKFQRPLINTVINKLTDNTGVLTLPVNKVLNVGGGDNITVHSVTISGLNTFYDAALLSPSPLSNQAIRSQLSLGTLDVVLNVTVALPSTPYYTYTEWLLLEGKLVNTSLLLDTVIPVPKSTLDALYVNQLAQPGCWIDSVSVASLSLETTVDTLAINQVRGSAVQLDKDAAALINNVLALVIDGYGPLVSNVINGVVEASLRPVVNDKISSIVSQLTCSHICPSDNQYVIWANNTLVGTIGYLLNDVIGPVGLNTILRAVTHGTGSLTISSGPATVTLGGLASFYTLSVLQPTPGQPYDLTSSIGLGACNSQLCNPLSITVSVSGGLSNISLPFQLPPSIASQLAGSSLHFSVALSNLNVQLETIVELSKGMLCDLRVSQLGTRGCVFSTAHMVALKSLSAQVTGAQSTLNNQPPHDSTAVVQKFLTSLSSPATLGSINAKLAGVPENANRTCLGLPPLPHASKAPVTSTHNISAADFGSAPSPSSADAYNYWEVPVVVFCVLSAVLLLGLCCYREHKLYVAPLARDSRNKDNDEWTGTSNNCSLCMQIYNLRWSESLIGSRKISFLTKAFVVVSLGVCFGLFIRCLLDKDVLSIKTSLTTAGKSTEITIYNVALPDIINDLWDSGSYLASFLGGFGMVWCYPVIVIAGLCFLLPPEILPVSHRGNWLSFCCLAAKANNVNWYFSVYFDPLFYFDVQPAPSLDVLTYWVIERGFTIYACVFFYFLVLLQITLACHRVAVEKDLAIPPGETGAIEALELECMKDHSFSVSADLIPTQYLADDQPAGDQKVSIQFTALTKVLVLIFIWATFALLLCSSLLQTMTYKILGLLSLLITENPTSEYSLVSIAQYFPQTTGDPSNAAGIFVTALFVLYSLVIPLIAVIGFAALWYIPMKATFQRNVLIFTEACLAFAQFDVAVLTLIVNTQTDSFAAFLALVIGNYCDGINVILAEYFDTKLDGNDQCFTISTHLSHNSWTIFVALVGYLSLVLIVLLSFGIASEERRASTTDHATAGSKGLPSASTVDDNLKVAAKAKLGSTDLDEPLLIRGNDELIADNGPVQKSDSLSVQTLTRWRKVKSLFLRTCLFLSIVEIVESSSKVARQSMDGREVDPTF